MTRSCCRRRDRAFSPSRSGRTTRRPPPQWRRSTIRPPPPRPPPSARSSPPWGAGAWFRSARARASGTGESLSPASWAIPPGGRPSGGPLKGAPIRRRRWDASWPRRSCTREPAPSWTAPAGTRCFHDRVPSGPDRDPARSLRRRRGARGRGRRMRGDAPRAVRNVPGDAGRGLHRMARRAGGGNRPRLDQPARRRASRGGGASRAPGRARASSPVRGRRGERGADHGLGASGVGAPYGTGREPPGRPFDRAGARAGHSPRRVPPRRPRALRPSRLARARGDPRGPLRGLPHGVSPGRPVPADPRAPRAPIVRDRLLQPLGHRGAGAAARCRRRRVPSRGRSGAGARRHHLPGAPQVGLRPRAPAGRGPLRVLRRLRSGRSTIGGEEPTMTFPMTRMRRLRATPALRAMTRETALSATDLVAPLFVAHGDTARREIASMPGHAQLSVKEAVREAKELAALGVGGLILFGIPRAKDAEGSEAYAADGIVPRALTAIKEAVPDILLWADVCLCEYTDHGHCGVVVNGAVDNDRTLPLLSRAAVAYARAGADLIAPSDMMDGRVGVIRAALDEAGFSDTPIVAYSAKYASAFYGPFREAAQSAPQFGDRSGYQMDPANAAEAMREVALDIEEGADMVMVKPALPYLDVIRRVKERFTVPVAAYNVSGEYSMIRAAAERGWIDGERAALEVLTSIRRAGADVILTYFAKEVAALLKPRKP